MNPKVILKGTGIKTPVPFELEHAQRIFDLQKRTPPKSWSIDPSDTNYELIAGKITLKNGDTNTGASPKED